MQIHFQWMYMCSTPKQFVVHNVQTLSWCHNRLRFIQLMWTQTAIKTANEPRTKTYFCCEFWISTDSTVSSNKKRRKLKRNSSAIEKKWMNEYDLKQKRRLSINRNACHALDSSSRISFACVRATRIHPLANVKRLKSEKCRQLADFCKYFHPHQNKYSAEFKWIPRNKRWLFAIFE